MINAIHQLTPSGYIRKPSYATLALWVKESWDEISLRLIRSAFKCCGISVEMDGSEDDLVFDYELLDEENANNENLEEVLNFDSIDGDEYEEVEFDNVWE